MKWNSHLPIVFVRPIDEDHLPPGLKHVSYGCYDYDGPCGSVLHIWIVPGDIAGQRRCFTAVNRNTVVTEVLHHGTVDDLRHAVLVDEASEATVFHPGML